MQDQAGLHDAPDDEVRRGPVRAAPVGLNSGALCREDVRLAAGPHATAAGTRGSSPGRSCRPPVRCPLPAPVLAVQIGRLISFDVFQAIPDTSAYRNI